MKISVALGDGIGPEIMNSALEVFRAARVPLEFEGVEMGRVVAERGEKSGISPEARRSVESTGILFKGPMETPKGGGYKSVNVTARKLWGAFANKRVYRLLAGVPNPLGLRKLDLTMVRENIEDTYGGVEHMQTQDVAQCRRFITRPGCEQFHRYAFTMAARKGARRITCGHKANIMKLTDGLFLETFYEVAKDFPQLEADDLMVDAMAMKLVLSPSEFDVVVLPNLQGDILTDLAAGLVGGLPYAPSANIGDGVCIFEAVHGTAPDIVGQDRANPTALLLSGTMMLRHVGLVKHAAVIEQALEKTLVAMSRPPDLAQPPPPFRTSVFTASMLEQLARIPAPSEERPRYDHRPRAEARMLLSPDRKPQALSGVDIFLESSSAPAFLAKTLEGVGGRLKLTMISNRGTQVWPSGSVYTDCVNHYRARFEAPSPVSQEEILGVLARAASHFTLCGSEWLREVDGQPAYSLAQGQS